MPFTLISQLLLLSMAALWSQANIPPVFPPADVKPKVWSYSEYRIVPVRVHLLREKQVAAAGTRLTDIDIARIFRKANGIWHQAGIHLRVESIMSEQPVGLAGHEQEVILPVEALQGLRPPETRVGGMYHIYYIGSMPPNGIFMGRESIFVKESARLRPVPGGIDEPLPRVSAHELGHGMGLPHRQDITNLMASGTTGTSLNMTEIEKVRVTISEFTWVETAAECLQKADALLKSGNKEQAISRYKTLLDLPGDDALKSRIQAQLKKVIGKPLEPMPVIKGA